MQETSVVDKVKIEEKLCSLENRLDKIEEVVFDPAYKGSKKIVAEMKSEVHELRMTEGN
jgi:archaellum component FlaC